MHSSDFRPSFESVAPERVGKGAALLDRKRPGWAHEISLDRLQMNNQQRCILGQLYRRYSDGVTKLGAHDPIRLGFTLGFSDITGLNCDELSGWDTLDRCWKDVIEERQRQPMPLRARFRLAWHKLVSDD